MINKFLKIEVLLEVIIPFPATITGFLDFKISLYKDSNFFLCKY